MPRVVILGGGFAGLSAAREFERRRPKVHGLEIVLVDRHNYMLFTPMLPEAASGSVDPEHITRAFRRELPRVRFELGEVLSVEEEPLRVTIRHPLTHETKAIGYDQLVLALGSAPSTLGIDGVTRCTLPLRTLADAQRLRDHVLGCLEVAASSNDIAERDRLLSFTIVGGGFTGVETAGELSAYMDAVRPLYPALQQATLRFVLIEAGSRLLLHLDPKFGKYAARVLRDRGVEIRLNVDVASVDPAGVTLKSGERYDSRTIVWCAGSEPAPFVKRLGLKLSEHHAIVTERDFSVPGHPRFWAIGDCAAVPRGDGGSYAPLAQNATREGPHVARNVIARIRGKKTTPFRYRKLGQMASLGNRHALAQLPGGLELRGLAAWVLWRGYYLGRLPGAGRKARVALDWTLGMAFGPSLARVPMVERGETSFTALTERETTR